LLRFLDYPKALQPVIKSTNLLERMIKEVKRTTKTRDNTFPTPDAGLKVIYFVAERYEALRRESSGASSRQRMRSVLSSISDTPRLRWGRTQNS